MVFLKWLAGLGMLLLGQIAFAAGPCPDGNFNPQNRVCMCPGGGYVGPGQWCEGGGGQVEIIPVPKMWGAIAIDMASGQKKASFRKSTVSQADASKQAVDACGLSTCKTELLRSKSVVSASEAKLVHQASAGQLFGRRAEPGHQFCRCDRTDHVAETFRMTAYDA